MALFILILSDFKQMFCYQRGFLDVIRAGLISFHAFKMHFCADKHTPQANTSERTPIISPRKYIEVR